MAVEFRFGSSTVPHESLVYFLILPCHPSYVTFFKCRTMNATSLGILSTVVRKKGKSNAKTICQIVTKSKLILFAVCVHAKALRSCTTLCNPMDCSLPGSFVHRILQARILENVAMPSSRGSSWPRTQTRVSCIGRWVLYHQWHLGSPFNQLHAVLSRSFVSDSLWWHGLWPARLLCPWDSPGKNIEVGFMPSSRASPPPRDWTQVSCIAGYTPI